jgi:hypothetical protein
MTPFDPMATALSAIANASATLATPDQVVSALRTGRGDPAHLRALFADTSFETLIRIGIRHGITNDEIGRAYLAARRHGARNRALDAWCQEQLGVPVDPAADSSPEER